MGFSGDYIGKDPYAEAEFSKRTYSKNHLPRTPFMWGYFASPHTARLLVAVEALTEVSCLNPLLHQDIWTLQQKGNLILKA